MSDSDIVKLVVLPFLQRWDATSKQLSLRVLLIPRDSFIVPFVPNNLTSPKFFPNAELKFNVRILPGIHDGIPEPGSGTVTDIITWPPNASYAAVFKSLVSTLGEKITKTPIRARPNDSEASKPKNVRKHLPTSYRNATGYSPRGESMFTTDNTYSCAMKQVRPKPYKKFEKRTFGPSWGEIIASILRIPDFALVAGFIRTQTVKIQNELLVDGAFIWLELDPQTANAIDIDTTSTLKTYASRIMPTTKSGEMFTPCLFPVIKQSELPPGIAYDDIYREQEDYADGWAKAVHCTQQQNTAMITEKPDSSRPVKDIGIRIGWDDEQVTIWADRHLNPDSAKTGYDNFPFGIHGYRVDVFDPDQNAWMSLSTATGQFGIGQTAFGQISGELGVEVHPVLPLDVAEDRIYWMPMYFTNWTQTSLVGPDERTLKLLGRYKPPSNVAPPSFPIIGVVDPKLKLRYGRKYQFRVRLMDHTGGGPTLNSPTGSVGPSPSTSMTFRRWVKPLAPQLLGTIPTLENKPGAETAVDFLEVKRPLMFYPAVMFAGYTYNGQDAATELLKMADAINSNPPTNGQRVTEPGLPDPDVDRVEITVLVQTLAQDTLATDGSFMILYTTTRALPTDLKASATISLKWIDCADVWKPDEPWTASTSYLGIPRARTVKLRINALCRDDPTPPDPYFGADDVRRGPPISVVLRKYSVSENNLLVSNTASYALNGFFLQPSLDAASQLATALGLRNKDTSLKAKEGKRAVFACSSSIMHVLGPDRGSLTFLSHPSLALQWLLVIRLTVQRDWSWDGFPVDAIAVTRENKGVTIFSPNQNANEAAISAPSPDRSSTDVVIFDVVDPKPQPGEFPKEITLQYKVTTKYWSQGSSVVNGPSLDLNINLPVTTPPRQIPQLASVGVAMSPYTYDDGYTSTVERTKMLWLEFAAPLEDPQDRYFCRVLKNAPDPLLLGDQFMEISTTETPEPAIPLDMELVRRIVPDQTLDTAGLEAMQPLIPTSSPLHWGLPLPPGLTSASLELLGFWTYEFRVGHWNEAAGSNPSQNRWSTAQGRYGPPLRTTGVQHPPPPLLCSVDRDASTVRVAARAAQPVSDGRLLLSKQHPTQLWFLLYAQVVQMDGSGQRRNILIARTRGTIDAYKADAKAIFYRDSFMSRLAQYQLRHNVPLSAMAVELLPQRDGVSDPLGGDLGRQRILRASCLVAVPSMC